MDPLKIDARPWLAGNEAVTAAAMDDRTNRRLFIAITSISEGAYLADINIVNPHLLDRV
jgi:hypothetical protein